MTASRRVSLPSSAEPRTDLAALDAHRIGPEEYDDIPELTDEMVAGADIHEGGHLVRRGRPRLAAPKKPVTIRLDADLADELRASGQGWQTRLNDMIRTWLSQAPPGPLPPRRGDEG